MLKKTAAQKIGNGQGARVDVVPALLYSILGLLSFASFEYEVMHEVQKPSTLKHKVKFEIHKRKGLYSNQQNIN